MRFPRKITERGYFQIDKRERQLHRDGNDNAIRIGNFATQKNLLVKSTMFSHLMGRLTKRCKRPGP